MVKRVSTGGMPAAYRTNDMYGWHTGASEDEVKPFELMLMKRSAKLKRYRARKAMEESSGRSTQISTQGIQGIRAKVIVGR